MTPWATSLLAVSARLHALSAEGWGLSLWPVLPMMQRRGIGSALVRVGLERCREIGCEFVVVVGYPQYHPRFGFIPAHRFGMRCSWPVPEGVFMALELRKEVLAMPGGLVRYEQKFDEIWVARLLGSPYAHAHPIAQHPGFVCVS